jgi:hypothetical protein
MAPQNYLKYCLRVWAHERANPYHRHTLWLVLFHFDLDDCRCLRGYSSSGGHTLETCSIILLLWPSHVQRTETSREMSIHVCSCGNVALYGSPLREAYRCFQGSDSALRMMRHCHPPQKCGTGNTQASSRFRTLFLIDRASL